MPSQVMTIIAGVVTAVALVVFLTGIFFAFRKFLRWMNKITFYSSIRKNEEALELIENYLDGTPERFKIEILLLNVFTNKEVEGFYYAFKKIKKLKGGMRSNGKKPKSIKSSGEDKE